MTWNVIFTHLRDWGSFVFTLSTALSQCADCGPVAHWAMVVSGVLAAVGFAGHNVTNPNVPPKP